MVRRDFISPGGQLADIRLNVDGDKGDMDTYSISFLSLSWRSAFHLSRARCSGSQSRGRGGRAAAAGENVGVESACDPRPVLVGRRGFPDCVW